MKATVGSGRSKNSNATTRHGARMSRFRRVAELARDHVGAYFRSSMPFWDAGPRNCILLWRPRQQ